MRGVEFFFLLDCDLIPYISILLSSLFIYFLIFRKWYISIFDPFILLQIYSALAASVVLFLKYEGFISDALFYQFCFSQIAYIIGVFTWTTPKLKDFPIIKKKINRYTIYIVNICFFFFLVFTLYTYYHFGIPLFLDSRLELYQKAQGLGFLGRICDVFQIVLFTIIFFQLRMYFFNLKYKLYLYFIIAFLLLTLFLSGSKSALILPFNVLFVLGFVVNVRFVKVLTRNTFFISLLLFGFALFVISVQQENGGFLYLIERIVAFGDIYYQSYVNDNIFYVEGNYIDFILGPFLRTFRLSDSSVNGIGNQIFEMLTSSDLNAGPNPRLGAFSLVCFGFVGSIIFSYLIGYLVSYIRNVMSLQIKNNILFICVYSYIYIKVLPFETDVSLSVNNLTSLLVSVLFFVLVINILKKHDSK